MVALRKSGHPGPGKVPRWRCGATDSRFVLEVEELWNQDGRTGTAGSLCEPMLAKVQLPRCPCTAQVTGTPSSARSMLRA